MTFTFFGQDNFRKSVKPMITEYLITLIHNGGAENFVCYVGDYGSFDRMIISILRRLKAEYPKIEYRIVPTHLSQIDRYGSSEIEIPQGIEGVPKRLANDFRNRWMLDKARVVIVYLTHKWGTAMKYASIGEQMGKAVANLSDVKELYGSFCVIFGDNRAFQQNIP